MAAKIYKAPKTIKLPEIDFENFDREQMISEQDRYINDVKKFCLKRKKGKNVGEIIEFPVADGSAMYMVASMRPLELIHLEIGDCWDYQYVHRLTATDVNSEIENYKMFN